MPFVISNTTGTFKYASQTNFDKYNGVISYPYAVANLIANTGATQISVGPSLTAFVYNSSGTFTVTSGGPASVLIVGGGGGGGYNYGGGGGAGGLVYFDTTVKPMTLAAGKYGVSVGAGGLGPTTSVPNGGTGGDSSFNGFIAKGGGGGAYDYNNGQYVIGANGGCGGGGGGVGATSISIQPSYSNAYYVGGYGGGSGYTGYPSGGGGGAGSVGANATGNGYGGAGGIGYQCNITGTQTYYAGGGGGAQRAGTGGNGGLGGGGNGAWNNSAGTSGIANTGGGGGGGTSNNGGSGVVIILCSSISVPVWADLILPNPILYFPFSKDLLNYASGAGLPFWYDSSGSIGTGSMAISNALTINGSAGSLYKSTGSHCLCATSNFPNNTYTLPANQNGYSVSFWVNNPGTSQNVFISMLPVPNSVAWPSSYVNETVGITILTWGNTGSNVGCFGATFNTGYSFTNNVWHHIVLTFDKSGSAKLYMNPASTASSSITGPFLTSTGTYVSNSGINDIRMGATGGAAGVTTTPSYGVVNNSYAQGAFYMSDFYYFDAVLTVAQIQYLHSTQVYH